MKRRININKFITGVLLTGMLLSLSSCLKNGPYDYNFAGAKASVDLPLAASLANGIKTVVYDGSVPNPVLPVYVNVASPNIPTTSTTATLALDADYLAQYNAANGTSYELLPDSTYQVSGWDVEIPAGQRLDSIAFTLDLAKIDLSHSYVLPVTIQEASLPIEQWNHVMYSIAVKNEWDGDYSITGILGGPNSYTGSDLSGPNTLSTINGNTVSEGDIGNFFGGYTEYKFNDDGTISVGCYTDASKTSSYGAVVTESGYDKTTHDFHVTFSILGGKYVFPLTYTRQ